MKQPFSRCWSRRKAILHYDMMEKYARFSLFLSDEDGLLARYG